jgi:hypothetical protein
MPLYNIPNMSRGIDDTLIGVVQAVPTFSIGILLFVWIVVLVGGTSSQTRRVGYADYPMWALLASCSTLLLSLIMTMKEGLISLPTLGIVVAITLLSGFWFFMSKGRNEI